MREGAREGCFPKHRRELYVSGASNRRQWRKVRRERNPSMAYPLGQPLDSLPPPHALLYLVFSPRALLALFVFVSFSLHFFFPWFIYPFCLSACASRSLFRHPSLDGRLRGQPLVNLIISAAPDKRRRQNVIPARSRSPLAHLEFQAVPMVDAILHIPPHHCRPSFFLPLAFNLILIFFPLAVPVYRRSFVRHPSIGPLTR